MTRVLNYFYKKLPNNWVLNLLILIFTPALTFYIFKLAIKLDLIEKYISSNEQYYLKTFIITQALISIFFYQILYKIIFVISFNFFKRKANVINHNISLKEISRLKNFLIRFFSIKINNGQFDAYEVLNFNIENKNEILQEICKSLSKWVTFLIQLCITCILVYKLDAFYVLPIIVIGLIFIFFFLYIISFLLSNLGVWNKIRAGIELRQKK